MNRDLHVIARGIRSFCNVHGINLSARWVPREENELADELSRKEDFDDWGITKERCQELEAFFVVKCTWDRFADEKNKKCERFTSKYWVKGCQGVNAFAQSWAGEVNWLVPPPNLVARTILFLNQSEASAILVAPWWPSANFWPLIFNMNKKWRKATSFPGGVMW